MIGPVKLGSHMVGPGKTESVNFHLFFAETGGSSMIAHMHQLQMFPNYSGNCERCMNIADLIVG